jgi:glucosamine--fructose-6-phosphate aminotransferase (isomerizing)
VASEFRYSNPIIDERSLIILISQSGETADTLAALEIAREKGAKTLSIVNVEYSTLAKLSNAYLPIKAGVEVAVASTKAYSAQLTVLYLLSLLLAEKKYNKKFSLDEVVALYEHINFTNVNDYKLLAGVLRNNEKLFMIGRGIDYFTALEACLKIKETSYINSDTYYSGELKHGFLALIEEDTYLIAFATDKIVFTKTISNAEEAKARGAKVILFTCFELSEAEMDNFYYVIKVDNIKTSLQCVINILPWQFIAYYISISKGINPDKPRNLAKSVTVE